MTSHLILRPALWIAGVLSIAAAVSLSSQAAETRIISAAPYEAELSGRTVAFLARDLETGIDFILDGSELQQRHTPHSTFKIPNLLIALETGIAGSLDDHRVWDQEKRPVEPHWPAPWRQDQTLGEAFARSTVWYFQDLSLEIGTDAYRSKLSEWRYGNADVAAGSDVFWLDGSLRISVNEQVTFLENLLEAALDIRSENIAALDQASLSGTEEGLTLHGKTGIGPDDFSNWDGAFSGWYVGYLRRENRAPVVFALHASGPSFSSIAAFRRPFALRLLTDAGLMPPMP